jgi:hypothetical protein
VLSGAAAERHERNVHRRQPQQARDGAESEVAGGRQVLIDLVKTADVFVENFRPARSNDWAR